MGVGRKKCELKINDVKRLIEEKFKSVIKEDWGARCNHIFKIEKSYIEKEGILDSVVDNITLNLAED